MVKPGDRTKKKKFVRTPKGKSKRITKAKRPSKQSCALCKSKLLGVIQGSSNKRKNTAKTKKRPSVVFGGVLCSKCRTRVFEEGIMLKSGVKKLDEIELRLHSYIKQIERRIE
ncbi:MAG: hypothetical protein ABH821_00150 [archaeon]